MLVVRFSISVLGQRARLMVGVAVIGVAAPCWAQQATTLSGAPVQLQPYVSEPGVPTVTVTVGTPNPFGGLDGGDGSSGGSGGVNSGSSGRFQTQPAKNAGARPSTKR